MKAKKIAAILFCVVLTLCLCCASFFAVAENNSPDFVDPQSSETQSGEEDNEQTGSYTSSGSVLVEFASSSEVEISSSQSQTEIVSSLESVSSEENPSSDMASSSEKAEASKKEEVSSQEQKPIKKNILSLSDILKYLIIIPILLMIAAVVTLVLVNKKGWLEGVIEKKRKNNTKKS